MNVLKQIAVRITSAMSEEEALKKKLHRLEEKYYQVKDWNTTGTHDERLKKLRQQIKDTKEQLKKLR